MHCSAESYIKENPTIPFTKTHNHNRQAVEKKRRQEEKKKIERDTNRPTVISILLKNTWIPKQKKIVNILRYY